MKSAVFSENPREFIRVFEKECLRDSNSRQIFQNAASQFVDNPTKIGRLSDKGAFGLLKNLTNELEDQFFPYGHLDKVHNKISSKPRRSSQMIKEQPKQPKTLTGAPPKEFSTFIGSKRGGLTSGFIYKSMRGFSNNEAPQEKSKQEKENSSPFKNFIRKAVSTILEILF